MNKKHFIGLLFSIAAILLNCKGHKFKEKYTCESCILLLNKDSTYNFEFKEARYNQPEKNTYNFGKWNIDGKYLVLNTLKYVWSETPNYVESMNSKIIGQDSILISVYSVDGGDTTLNRYDVSTIEYDDNKFIIPINGFPFKTKTPVNLNFFILWYLTGKCEKKYTIKNPEKNEFKIYIDASTDLSDKPLRFEYFETEKLKIMNNKLLFLNKVELK